MRGRKPSGPELVDDLPGSEIARTRLRALLRTIGGECRVLDACREMDVSEARYHQLKQTMLLAALESLEPHAAGRPAKAATPAEEEIERLRRELAERDEELKLARVREEIAVVLPRRRGAEPEKKTPRRGSRRSGAGGGNAGGAKTNGN